MAPPVFERLSVLSEPLRVRLLVALSEEELTVGELARVVDTPQSTVSRHLKHLHNAGWVRRRAEGTANLFRFDRAGLDREALALWGVVDAQTGDAGWRVDDHGRLERVRAARAMDGEAFFEHNAERWDALRTELFGAGLEARALLSLLPPDWVVADLGCGTGANLAAVAPYVGRVIGVDREPQMLAAAAARCEGLDNVELREGRLDDLPIEAASVDAALVVLVLHHVRELAPVFTEVARILKPGGRLVLVDMPPHDRAAWRQSMGHRHLGFARTDLEPLVDAAGLRIEGWSHHEVGNEVGGLVVMRVRR